MELLVFILFQLLMKVQSYESPTVKVSPDIIRESSSMKISCEMPAGLPVNLCYFYPNSEEKNIKPSWRCELDLTGAEVFRWAAVKSPESIDIYCYYTIQGINQTLPHSLPATVLGLPRAKLRASASVILETERVELSCENTDDLKMEMCVFNINGRKNNSKQSSSCQLSLTGSQISIWSGDQSSSVTITCIYTVMKRQVQKTSDHSDPVTVTVQISTSTTTKQTNTISIKTTLAVMSTSEITTYNKTSLHSKTSLSTSMTTETMVSNTTSTFPGDSRMSEHTSTEISTHKASEIDISTTAVIFPTSPRTAVSSIHTSTAHPTDPLTSQHTNISFIVLVSTGVAVILSGLICLCWFASKKRRKHNKMRSINLDVPIQEIGMSCSGPAEIYSLITSVPATSQPISGGPKHPEPHQDSTADPTDTNSFIMSVNSIYQPSDHLVNKQQEKGNTEENENVYHLYCTIPDKPVRSNAEDQVYSLVQ